MDKLINVRLQCIRRDNNMTRKALEFISGFKVRNIASYERGENQPPKEYIEFISLYFGYTEEYIKGNHTDNKYINKTIKIILMYQSIYIYNDNKMAKLLQISVTDYIKLINEAYLSIGVITNYFEKKREHLNYNEKMLNIAFRLNIKISSFNFDFINDDNTIDNIFSSYLDDDTKTTTISEYIRDKALVNVNNSRGIEITPTYYASIIKKRNEPKKSYTPNDEAKNIPPKYKELLALLPFAPDSFVDTIIVKLKNIKENQIL